MLVLEKRKGKLFLKKQITKANLKELEKEGQMKPKIH